MIYYIEQLFYMTLIVVLFCLAFCIIWTIIYFTTVLLYKLAKMIRRKIFNLLTHVGVFRL